MQRVGGALKTKSSYVLRTSFSTLNLLPLLVIQ